MTTYSSGSNIFFNKTDRDCIDCGILTRGLLILESEIEWGAITSITHAGSGREGAGSVLASFCISA